MTAPAVARPTSDSPHAAMWQLIERSQGGDREAFAAIYETYHDATFRYIYFRVGNKTTAQDLHSEVWLRVLNRIGSFTYEGRDIGAWVVTIARNLIADHFKSGQYRLSITVADMSDADREDRAPEGSPETTAVDRLMSGVLRNAVKQLNPEQRECIVLRFFRGCSVSETAEVLGISAGACKALQYRAVRTLGSLLPDGFDPAGREPVTYGPSTRRS